MKKIFQLASVLVLGIAMSSCLDSLNKSPLDPNILTADEFFKNPDAYNQTLSKCYAGLAVSGLQGPAGNADISGYDEGAAQYIRAFWNLQELPTDEAIVGWNDPGLPELNTMNWSSDNGFVYVMYSRIYFQIAQCNEFLRQSTDEMLNKRDIAPAVRALIPQYRDEVRFLRALSYWHAIDLFGNVPFITDAEPLGAIPVQKSRTDVFNYIVSELKNIETNGNVKVTAEYPRVNLSAVETLLAKLYLNAKVYTGTEHWVDAKTYCAKVITAKGAGATGGLALEYKYLFGGDNDKYAKHGSEGEIIFAIAYDFDHTQTYGGTMYLSSGAYGGDMKAADYGLKDAWGGLRVKPQLVDKFSASVDKRYLLFDSGNKENTSLSMYKDGFGCFKYTNLLSTDWANAGKRSKAFPDTDYPMFRLADVYLMYAEAAVRSNTNLTEALNYVNLVRARADLNPINAGDLTLDNILDERGRELYWEASRRTDLVRFDKFTGGNYLWSWKGGVIGGKATDSKYRLYPIPAKDIAANPNIAQNPGYN